MFGSVLDWLSRTAALALAVTLVACGEASRSGDEQANDSGAMMNDDRATPSAAIAEVRGSAFYRERIALPENATFEATLEDVSQADAPAQEIARASLDPAGQPPFRFVIGYDPAQIQPGRTYAIRARVTHGEQLLFTSDRHYPLPTAGENLEILLVRSHASASTATLQNTYWKLMRLGDVEVNVAPERREPHFVLHAEGNRVAGHGGCNGFTGSYSLSNDTLSFSQLAGTMMACDRGMEYEQAFHDALGRAATWRIDGETLELFDANGASVAQFESRYLR